MNNVIERMEWSGSCWRQGSIPGHVLWFLLDPPPLALEWEEPKSGHEIVSWAGVWARDSGTEKTRLALSPV